MVQHLLIYLYVFISLFGLIIYYAKQWKSFSIKQYGAVSIFLISHLFLLSISLVYWEESIPIPFLLLGFVGCLLSRVINGQLLFGKNHWPHYIVTGAIMIIIFLVN